MYTNYILFHTYVFDNVARAQSISIVSVYTPIFIKWGEDRELTHKKGIAFFFDSVSYNYKNYIITN